MKIHVFRKKQMLCAAFAAGLLTLGVLCTALVPKNHAVETAAAVTYWGLSFQTEGAPPVANASQDYLKDFNALYVGDTNKKEIYITFDAGFENGNTEKI